MTEGEPFWRNLRSRRNAAAIVDADSGTVLTYANLADQVERTATALQVGRRALILLFTSTDVAGLLFYLAALLGRHAIFLSPLAISHPGSSSLIERYRPDFVLFRAGTPRAELLAEYAEGERLNGYHVFTRRQPSDPPPALELALLLSTSGSTGNPKAVRLSTRGLGKSAQQVARALSIEAHDRALQSLPFSYIYGLTVLKSALSAGAAVVLISETPAERDYWTRVSRAAVTTIAAVSLTFELMRSLNIGEKELPTVTRLTHSGDALDADLFTWVYEHFDSSRVAIYLMYGQTEAGGRMAVLPPRYLPEARGSVGQAVPDSEIVLNAQGEILFRGPGVMLGYAARREDLNLGDTLNGTLHTGDVGRFDSQGLLHITGRSSRYCKVYGKRISLDDIEAFLRSTARAAAIVKGAEVIVFFEERKLDVSALRMELTRHFQVPPQSFRLLPITRLPRGERGKVAYEALRTLT